MTDKKILIVDDEIHIVHVVTIKLRNNGYQVISADNGADAFDLACKERPDVIITDLQMPAFTGLELAEKIRRCDDIKDVPIIMLTARSFAVSSQDCERLRISHCLSKPFSPRELLALVEDILFRQAVKDRTSAE
jgi:two-component system alkaline phosphatase synthesis response regulator PhoP